MARVWRGGREQPSGKPERPLWLKGTPFYGLVQPPYVTITLLLALPCNTLPLALLCLRAAAIESTWRALSEMLATAQAQLAALAQQQRQQLQQHLQLQQLSQQSIPQSAPDSIAQLMVRPASHLACAVAPSASPTAFFGHPLAHWCVCVRCSPELHIRLALRGAPRRTRLPRRAWRQRSAICERSWLPYLTRFRRPLSLPLRRLLSLLPPHPRSNRPLRQRSSQLLHLRRFLRRWPPRCRQFSPPRRRPCLNQLLRGL